MVNNDLLGLGSAAVIVIVILQLVLNFLTKWKLPNSKSEDRENGFRPRDRRCLDKIEIQVDEMHTKLEVNKELQRALSTIIYAQSTQTKILNHVTELQAQTLELIKHVLRPEL